MALKVNLILAPLMVINGLRSLMLALNIVENPAYRGKSDSLNRCRLPLMLLIPQVIVRKSTI